MNPREVIKRIGEERLRQDVKWGTEFGGRPDQQWLAILMEEVGEAAQEVLQTVNELDGLKNLGRIAADERLEAEVIQIAAVCCSWLEFRTPFLKQIRSDVLSQEPPES